MTEYGIPTNNDYTIGEDSNSQYYTVDNVVLPPLTAVALYRTVGHTPLNDSFVANGNSSLSGQELTLICGGKFNQTHFKKWNLDHRYHNIIEKTNSGKWVLRKQIINYLNLKV